MTTIQQIKSLISKGKTEELYENILSSFPLLNALLNSSAFRQEEKQYLGLVFNVFNLEPKAKIPLELIKTVKKNKKVMI